MHTLVYGMGGPSSCIWSPGLVLGLLEIVQPMMDQALDSEGQAQIGARGLRQPTSSISSLQGVGVPWLCGARIYAPFAHCRDTLHRVGMLQIRCLQG